MDHTLRLQWNRDLLLADHLVSMEFNKIGPWQTDPFSPILFQADVFDHLVSNAVLLTDGLASLNACSHLASAVKRQEWVL